MFDPQVDNQKTKMPYKDPLKQREYEIIWHRNKRLAVKIAVVKLLGNKCAICGYNDNIRALQIDHIEPILRGSNIVKWEDVGTNLQLKILA